MKDMGNRISGTYFNNISSNFGSGSFIFPKITAGTRYFRLLRSAKDILVSGICELQLQ
jgi:hypothetical protein